MQKATYTLGEAAMLLSCHKETLRRAISAGELQAARLGREYRISRMDLQAFWTAQGGGELFDRAEPQPGTESTQTPTRSKENVKPPVSLGPQQLTLLDK